MMGIYGSAGRQRWNFGTFCGNFYYFNSPGYDAEHAVPPPTSTPSDKTNLAVKVWVLRLSIPNHCWPVGKSGFLGAVVEHHPALEEINNAKI